MPGTGGGLDWLSEFFLMLRGRVAGRRGCSSFVGVKPLTGEGVGWRDRLAVAASKKSHASSFESAVVFFSAFGGVNPLKTDFLREWREVVETD